MGDANEGSGEFFGRRKRQITLEGSGEGGPGDDGLIIEVTNESDGKCDAKVLVCMYCPKHDDDMELDSVEAWQQFAKDAARANFKDIVEGVGHCLPVMDPVNTNEPIDLNQIHFP